MKTIMYFTAAMFAAFAVSCAPALQQQAQCQPPQGPLKTGTFKTGEEHVTAYKPVKQKITHYSRVENVGAVCATTPRPSAKSGITSRKQVTKAPSAPVAKCEEVETKTVAVKPACPKGSKGSDKCPPTIVNNNTVVVNGNDSGNIGNTGRKPSSDTVNSSARSDDKMGTTYFEAPLVD